MGIDKLFNLVTLDKTNHGFLYSSMKCKLLSAGSWGIFLGVKALNCDMQKIHRHQLMTVQHNSTNYNSFQSCKLLYKALQCVNNPLLYEGQVANRIIWGRKMPMLHKTGHPVYHTGRPRPMLRHRTAVHGPQTGGELAGHSVSQTQAEVTRGADYVVWAAGFCVCHPWAPRLQCPWWRGRDVAIGGFSQVNLCSLWTPQLVQSFP